MKKNLKKVAEQAKEVASEISDKHPTNTTPAQGEVHTDAASRADAATTEPAPATGTPENPDTTGPVVAANDPKQPVAPTGTVNAVADGLVHKSLRARGIQDGEYAIKFPSEPPDEVDGKFVARQTCPRNPVEGYDSRSVNDAKRVLDKVKRELHELSMQVPRSDRASTAFHVAAGIIASTISNVKFDMPSCYVPIENIADELGVDARVFSETAKTLGAQKGKYHFLHNDNMYIDSRIANEILRCHSNELDSLERFDYGCNYNPTTLVPKALQLIFGTKDSKPGYPGIEFE